MKLLKELLDMTVLSENIEDQHADLYNAIEELLTNVGNDQVKVKFQQRFDTINELFSTGYDLENETLGWQMMGKALDQLEELQQEIKHYVAISNAPGSDSLQ